MFDGNSSKLISEIVESNRKLQIADAPTRYMWADRQFEILKKYIQEYERTLDMEHEVGIKMTHFGQSVLMMVEEITCEGPVLLVFKGYVNGRETTLIQHINQLNYLLTSIEKNPEKEKKPIGFRIE